MRRLSESSTLQIQGIRSDVLVSSTSLNDYSHDRISFLSSKIKVITHLKPEIPVTMHQLLH